MRTPFGQFFPSIPIGGTDTIILPSGNHRRTITLFQTFNTTLTITFGSVAVYKVGILLSTASAPLTFVRDGQYAYGIEVGSLIDTDVHVIAGGAGTIAALVTFDP